MPSPSVSKGKVYKQPILRELAPEQAILYLVGYAYIGHRGAKELLELLFPMSTDSTGLPADV